MVNYAMILETRISLVAPIEGVSIGNLTDKGTWLIQFKAEATQEQRAAAQSVIDQFDVAAEDAIALADQVEYKASILQLRAEYLSAVARLQQIEDFSGTITLNILGAAVKDIAKILRLLLKLLRRQYNEG